MDGLSAAASVVALVQISGQIYNLCQTYYAGVKSAREDIRRLRDEVTSLQDVLNGVADLADSPASAKLAVLGLLNQPDGLVQQCQTELAGLTTKLADGQGNGTMKKFGMRALKWPFTKKDVDAIISIIGRQKALFHLALTTDITTLIVAIDQGITQLRHDFAASRVDNHQDKIIKWLSCTDPSSNHLAACKKCQPTTGEWFTKGSSMKEWMETQNSLLWLHGIPGCGKTVLSSTIIEEIKPHCDKPGSALAYFYFDFSDSEKQNLSNLLSSLLAQLYSKTPCLPEQMAELYAECNNGEHKASVTELTEALSMIMLEFDDQVFLVIDALDEFAKIGERDELLTLLGDINSWSLPTVHLIVTSRPEPDIKAVMMPLSNPEAIYIQGSQVQSDISFYIRNQLAEDPKLKKWPSEVKVDIEKALSARADGIKRNTLLKTLDNLPETLDDTYARILSEIDRNDMMEARRALLWLVFSARPLGVEKLAEAAVVDPESDPPFSPENRFLDPHGDILEILGSLVTTSVKPAQRGPHNGDPDDGDPDDGDSDDWSYDADSDNTEVKLAHFSVKDYLLSERIQSPKTAFFSATPVDGNSFIARSCLLYILHYTESYPKSTEMVSRFASDDVEKFPLLLCAYRLWYVHAKAVPARSRMSVDLIAFKLLVSSAASTAWLREDPYFSREFIPVRRPKEMYSELSLPLYCASSLGLEGVVRMLLELKVDTNTRWNSFGMTALSNAAARGYEGVVRLLLEHDGNIEVKDRWGNTALQIAAAREHESVVWLLLEHDANIEAKDRWGDTVLLHAASKGRERVVRVLLEHGANVDEKVRSEWTALHEATHSNFESVVRTLIEKGANINSKDGDDTLRCI
ncbi:Ankyrin repeat and KH domain-containing protein [Lachnellula occidentalis]|uniref:Ankyrin repeat and KH domain-containing protein n=1 Tax=Lachnellula occidentalis TaxID=215460 RepID=A0A8H8U8U9_9HELO|nr:Ankyrin repeat and KH domain-containing protein [Lachnellula occidentalis]